MELGREALFVCIEGLDKSGKTSQSILLVNSLSGKGFDAVYTTEPSRGEIGKFIRRHVLSRKERVPAVVEALLFAADREDHVETQIKPMLKEGKVIVSDRYVYSSLAYQGAAGLDIEWIKEINRSALKPDLAIYLDVPVEVVSRRSARRRSVMELPYIQKAVQEVYLRFVREGELVPIDGKRPIEEVSRDIEALVLERLEGQTERV
jgi:dTMP kinase